MFKPVRAFLATGNLITSAGLSNANLNTSSKENTEYPVPIVNKIQTDANRIKLPY